MGWWVGQCHGGCKFYGGGFGSEFRLGKRRGMVCRCGIKTTTRHDKLEVVVDLYVYIRRRATVN